MRLGKKTAIRAALCLLMLFVLSNICWFVWRAEKYGAYIEGMETNYFSTWIVPRYTYTDADGYDYGVKYPDYLSLTGKKLHLVTVLPLGQKVLRILYFYQSGTSIGLAGGHAGFKRNLFSHPSVYHRLNIRAGGQKREDWQQCQYAIYLCFHNCHSA